MTNIVSSSTLILSLIIGFSPTYPRSQFQSNQIETLKGVRQRIPICPTDISKMTASRPKLRGTFLTA